MIRPLPNCKILIFISLLFLCFFDTQAHAACFNEPLDGTWINQEAETKDLIKLHIVHECTQTQTEDGLIVPGSRWLVKAWTKCYPANCTWGRTQAQKDPAGNINASMSTYAADRFLKIGLKGGNKNEVTVHLIVNYHDPRRKDIDTNVVLTRVE